MADFLPKSIEQIRREIDQLNHALVQLLDQRFMLVAELGEVKKQMGLPVRDLQRELAMNNDIEQQLKSSPFSHEIQNLFKQIIELSAKIQH